MKRLLMIVPVFLSIVMVFTSCSQEPAALDLKDAGNKLESLTNQNEELLFPDPVHPSSEELMDVYAIDTQLLEDWQICLTSNSSFYFLLLPKEGKSNEVKNQIANYLDKTQNDLELYEPEEYNKVKNHLETLRGSILVYIASSDNTAAIDAIDQLASE